MRAKGNVGAQLTTRLILGVTISAETAARVRALSKRGTDAGAMNFCVFQCTIGRKVVYCCWSGGRFAPTGPLLTTIGAASLEALENLALPAGDLIMQEVRLGPTPLQVKVIETLLAAPPGARVCFLGDLEGELDGQMGRAFNLHLSPLPPLDAAELKNLLH
jgi:hypothetical protein